MSVTQQPEIADSQLTAARKMHPEDISVGDDVSLALVSYQYPSYLWWGVDLSMLPAERILRLAFLPAEFKMLVVKSICLPFVFCKTIQGKHQVFDLRQVELMKLNREFAAAFRKGKQHDAKRTKAGKKKKRKSK